MDEIDLFLQENTDILDKWGVDTDSKLVKLLANYGKKPLQEAVNELRQHAKQKEKP